MIERIRSISKSKRFLGAETEMVVHELKNEDTKEQGCYINPIFKRGHAIVFFLNTVEEVHRQGHGNCERCLRKRASRFSTKLRVDE